MMSSVFWTLLLINFLLAQQSLGSSIFAETSLWLQNKFTKESCEAINKTDVITIRSYLEGGICKRENKDPVLEAMTQFNDIAEFEFFHKQGENQLIQFDCEIDSVERFTKDDKLLELRAQEALDKLPFLKEQMREADLAYVEFKRVESINNNDAGLCRQAQGPQALRCSDSVAQKRVQEKDLEKKWNLHRSLALSNVASMWNGSTESMSTFFEKLGRRTKTPTLAELKQELKAQVPFVRKELTDNKNELLGQTQRINGKRNFTYINDETKAQLVQNAVSGGYFSQAAENKDPAMIKLLCRLEGKYTKGRDKMETAMISSTFLLGGLAGFLSKIPVAVRAGTMGSMLSKAKSGSAIIGSAATGLDLMLITDSVRKSCFADQLNFTLENSCSTSAEENRLKEIKKVAQNNCILSAVLDVAPAGALAASTAFKMHKINVNRYHRIMVDKENPSIKGYLDELGRIQVEAQRNHLARRPDINEDRIRQNQSDAEAYIVQHKLPVAAVPKDFRPDPGLLLSMETRLRSQSDHYQTFRGVIVSSRDRLIREKHQLLTEVESLKTEVASLQKAKPTGPELAEKKRLLAEKSEELTLRDMRIESTQHSLQKLDDGHVARVDEIDRQLQNIHANPVEFSQFRSSLDLGLDEYLQTTGSTVTSSELAVLRKTREVKKVYTFTDVPKANPRATAASPFWQHPDFKQQFENLRDLKAAGEKDGVTIVIDPQNYRTAFYDAKTKTIYLNQNARYDTFVHEYTHAIFDYKLSRAVAENPNRALEYGQLVKSSFKSGNQLKLIAPEDWKKFFTAKDMDYLQDLLTKYRSINTADESLAVRKQLQTFGLNPIDSKRYMAQMYGAYYRVDDLLQSKNLGPLTQEQTKLLDQEIRKVGFNLSLFHQSKAFNNQMTQIQQQIRNGQIPMALAAWRAVRDKISEAQNSDQKMFFNAKGDVIIVSEDGKRLTTTSLNFGK